MTAEEIFNMFFGGGMPGSSVYVRRGGRWHRQAGNMQEQQVTIVVVKVMVAMVMVRSCARVSRILPCAWIL